MSDNQLIRESLAWLGSEFSGITHEHVRALVPLWELVAIHLRSFPEDLRADWQRAKARERLACLAYRAMPYERYLKSDHWECVRTRCISRWKTCCLCNSSEDLQVHHRTYKRLGAELDEDVVLLCDDCHARHHGKPSKKELQLKELLGKSDLDSYEG